MRLADISGKKKKAHLKGNINPLNAELNSICHLLALLGAHHILYVSRIRVKELETKSKIKNIRDLYKGINDFKKGYQPRTNTVKDENGDLVADSHSILARWRNYFSQLLNVLGVNEVRQIEIHTTEPEPSAYEVELAIENIKSHKSPGIDQIPAELIKAGGRTIPCEIHKLIISIWNEEELPVEW